MLRQRAAVKAYLKKCMVIVRHILCMTDMPDTNQLPEKKRQHIAGHMFCGFPLRRPLSFLRTNLHAGYVIDLLTFIRQSDVIRHGQKNKKKKCLELNLTA